MISKLRQITDTILFIEDHPGKRREACVKLYNLFIQLSELNSFAKAEIETRLSNGIALSPTFAARCVADSHRTAKFLRGIYYAVIEAKRRFPNEQIEILYAGCGPFAALAVPLCTKFAAHEIKFTLIDIHEVSINSARKIFEKLNLNQFVREFIQTDACLFQSAQKFHIIIAETMQKSLEKEPQVAVTQNLAPQLYENGIFIPQKITVDVCLADLNKEFTPERHHFKLATIIELTQETKSLPKVIVEIPENTLDAMLSTKIQVFDTFELAEYDSGITCPTVLFDLSKIKSKSKFEFSYRLGDKPQICYREIEEEP